MLEPQVHAPSTSLGSLLLFSTHFLFLLDFIFLFRFLLLSSSSVLFFFPSLPCLRGLLHQLPRIHTSSALPSVCRLCLSFRGGMGCLVSARSPLFPGFSENSIALIQNPVHLNSCLDNMFQFSRLPILPIWRQLRGFALQRGKKKSHCFPT